ncbi:MAG: DUF1080 domain-containing protein [Limisphaerales bacterium]
MKRPSTAFGVAGAGAVTRTPSIPVVPGILGILAILAVAGTSCSTPAGRGSNRRVDLLSPSHLPSWRQAGPGRFVVENGVASGEGGMGLWWFSGRPFTNFVLRGEFLQEQPIADSGVFVRFPDPLGDPWNAVKQGHEMEIGDPEPEEPTWRTGSIYPFAAAVTANTRPPGVWNHYELSVRGHTYTVRINGKEVTRWTDPQRRSASGFVGLQNYDDGKTVRHRHLVIEELFP